VKNIPDPFSFFLGKGRGNKVLHAFEGLTLESPIALLILESFRRKK
jgi:hypothetical protein